MNIMFKVYVIIPHYIMTDELKDLATNAIKSFRESYPEAIIISVDDGSPMDTTFLKDLSDVFLQNKENSGFAKTCNNGFKWVLYNNDDEDAYIICANNDIIINKKTIPALIEPFDLFENVAITGIISTTSKDWEGIPLEEASIGRITEGGLLRDRMQDGGLWMSTKKVLKKIGLFDEQFLRGGFEDVDLFLRARDSFGMKIVMSGHGIYWHKQGATRWNTINGFNHASKEIENDNYVKFRNKWKFDPHRGNPWKEIDLFNN
jgi:GT2 family glycosyltransferase